MIYAARCSGLQEIMKMFYIEYENLLIHASSFAKCKEENVLKEMETGFLWCRACEKLEVM